MSLLKWKNSTGEWISIYMQALRNRLRKDKNLADIQDKAAARKNLEIVGENNTTHLHDHRYLPLIQIAKDECLNLLDQIKAEHMVDMDHLESTIKALEKQIAEIIAVSNADTVDGKHATNTAENLPVLNSVGRLTNDLEGTAFNIPTKDVNGNIWIEDN